MRKLLLTMFALAVLGGGIGQTAQASSKFLHHKKNLTLKEKVNYFERSVAHEHSILVWLKRVNHNVNLQHGRTNFQHALRREIRFHRHALRWHKKLLSHYTSKYQRKMERSFSPIDAICYVFGPYCSQAIAVSRCETGGTFSVYAQNGQYLGLFQMGTYARGRYGHSSTALGQARAAYGYFRDSGYSWGPWECKP